MATSESRSNPQLQGSAEQRRCSIPVALRAPVTQVVMRHSASADRSRTTAKH